MEPSAEAHASLSPSSWGAKEMALTDDWCSAMRGCCRTWGAPTPPARLGLRALQCSPTGNAGSDPETPDEQRGTAEEGTRS
eukprot:701853-Rhodomonas_salina.1